MPLFKIDIDLGGTIEEFKLSDEQVKNMCDSVSQVLTMEIHRNWVEAAKRQLNSTRNSYIRGLIVDKEQNGVNSITLVGQLNNMIENGCSGFDMKEGFMKSAKIVPMKNGGWYLTIPFRIGTPDALGESEAFSGVMPEEIYDIVKNQAPHITDTDGSVVNQGSSLKASDIPQPYQIPTTRPSVIIPAINKTFDAYTHKSSIYEGMMRNQKTYEAATQSTYNTFRRVSSNSDVNSWIHKGIKQYNLADEGLRNTDEQTIVDNTVDKILSDYGF